MQVYRNKTKKQKNKKIKTKIYYIKYVNLEFQYILRKFCFSDVLKERKPKVFRDSSILFQTLGPAYLILNLP